MEPTAKIDFRVLRRGDLQKVLSSEREHLCDPAECLRSTRQDVVKSLRAGLSYGAFLNGELIAYNLCYDNEYRIAFVEKCFVHPNHRGHGLQSSLLMMNMSAMRKKGIINAFAMASPNNVCSLRNFRARGFETVGEIEFQGYKRLILRNGN